MPVFGDVQPCGCGIFRKKPRISAIFRQMWRLFVQISISSIVFAHFQLCLPKILYPGYRCAIIGFLEFLDCCCFLLSHTKNISERVVFLSFVKFAPGHFLLVAACKQSRQNNCYCFQDYKACIWMLIYNFHGNWPTYDSQLSEFPFILISYYCTDIC